jgi:hypothetical protein
MVVYLLLLLLTINLRTFAISSYSSSPTPSIQVLYEAPQTLFFENIAVRSNGHILLTALTEPTMYIVDPFAAQPTPKALVSFEGVNGMTGIAEPQTDLFVVSTANWNTTAMSSAPNSTIIWAIDLRHGKVEKRKIARLEGKASSNGLSTIPGSRDKVLSADSAGQIYSIDIMTGEYKVAIADEILKPTNSFPLGINGLHTYGGMLYITNSAKRLLARAPINEKGETTGDFKIVATLTDPAVQAYDDFAFDAEGNIWVATHPGQINKIYLDGKQIVAAGGGNSSVFHNPTSIAFGRGSRTEEQTVYVSTGGLQSKGSLEIQHGQLVAIRL